MARANGGMAAMDIDIGARINYGSAERADFATVEDVAETTVLVRWDDGAVFTRMPHELVKRLALTITELNA